jgi:2-amino-4-hydroxy-6-hydroxymethyldihydropteridine diphosphokinase
LTAPSTPSSGVRALVGLGGNVGDRLAYLRGARRKAAEFPKTRLLAASSLYETAPVGGPPQGPYLNAALLLSTELSPRELLAAMREVEDAARRARSVPDGPRTLDFDLLVYADVALSEKDLELPHPRFSKRLFALAPAADVAPDLVVPRTEGRTVGDLLRALPPSTDVVRVAAPEDWS